MINGTYLKCLEIRCFKVRHNISPKTERSVFYPENLCLSVIPNLDLCIPLAQIHCAQLSEEFQVWSLVTPEGRVGIAEKCKLFCI